MDIQSTIHLCSVPITPVNQIDFQNLTEQANYFRSKVVQAYTNCNYVFRSGVMRVKGYVDKLNNCNYGFYTNTYNGTTKTYYFWIVGKNLVAKETTELTIQIDVFQTWMFDIKYNPCLIERCHVTNDRVGAHTYPEDFELGDYVIATSNFVPELTGDVAYFIAITDSDSGNIGGKFGKIYSGFSIIYYAYNATDQLSAKILDLCKNGKADSIAFIYTFPQKMIDSSGIRLSSGDTIGGFEGLMSITYQLKSKLNFFTFKGDSYVPYNNKLLCYPYNMLSINNSSGGNVILKFENFSDDLPEFKIDGVLTQNPTFTCTPLSYNGTGFDIVDSISLQGFGLCSWNNDNFSNWYANNKNSINAQSQNNFATYSANKKVASANYNNALDNANTKLQQEQTSALLGVIGNALSLNLGGVASSVVSGINANMNYSQSQRNAKNDLSNSNLLNTTNYMNTVNSIMASVHDAQVQPNTCKGDTSSSGLDLARNTNTFYMYQMQIKPEYARMIDMYFQMYGYKVNTFAYPNSFLHNRERWNFLKTVNCSVGGNIPTGDREEINNLLNNGLTIWHNESYMYNYNIKNEVR